MSTSPATTEPTAIPIVLTVDKPALPTTGLAVLLSDDADDILDEGVRLDDGPELTLLLALAAG
jgi:hypothetical protein